MPDPPRELKLCGQNLDDIQILSSHDTQDEAVAEKAAAATEAAVAAEQRAVGELRQRAAEAEVDLKAVQAAVKKHHDAGAPAVGYSARALYKHYDAGAPAVGYSVRALYKQVLDYTLV